MKIGILSAMDIEHEQLVALMDEKREMATASFRRWTHGRLGGNKVALAVTGIGKVNAALGASEMFRSFEPDVLISSGCAGGLGREVAVKDVVVGSEYAYHDVDCGFGNAIGQVQGLPPVFKADERLLAAAEAMRGRLDVNLHTGLMVTGDQFIAGESRIAPIRANFPNALACEMESAALAHAAYLAKVPFISFRVISDTPGADGQLAQFESFWKELAGVSFTVVKTYLESL